MTVGASCASTGSTEPPARHTTGTSGVAALLDGIEHVVVGPACALTDGVQLPPALRRSLTWDRGWAMAEHQELAAERVSVPPWPHARVLLVVLDQGLMTTPDFGGGEPSATQSPRALMDQRLGQRHRSA